MPGLRIHRLRLPGQRISNWRRRVRREWCFVRALLHEFRFGLLIGLVTVLGGALLVRACEPQLDMQQAIWRSWSYVLGQIPNDFPNALLLRITLVVLPLMGLATVVQGITVFALALRDRQRNERGWSELMASSSSDHVVLVGLGRLGFRCWKLLHALGEDVVVIERLASGPFVDEVRRAGTPLIAGDARNDEILRAANVEKARTIVLATDEDMANLEAALDARRMNPAIRVVLRLFDQGLADKVREGFGIHIAMSQSAVAAAAFAMPAFDASIINSFVVDDELFVMQRWNVSRGSKLEGLTVGAVRDRHGFGVVQLERRGGEKMVFPDPSLPLSDGDRLLVQGPFAALARLRDGARRCPDFVWMPPLPVAAV